MCFLTVYPWHSELVQILVDKLLDRFKKKKKFIQIKNLS